jgi:hypothetical protein
MFEEVTAATFDKRQEAEEALRTLERDGMAVNKMSIVAVEPYEEHALRYFRTSERVLYWAGWAALCGVVWGFFAGPLFVHVPGYGSLDTIHFPPGLRHYFSSHIAANPLAFLCGPVINGLVFAVFGAIAALLLGLGTVKNSVVKYESSYSRRRYLLILMGSPEDVARARAISNKSGVAIAA